ncbi:Glucooligosaccharide oxidase [Paramyrothecium foliicola]|nr:Glucooligosaccharide oxidase [Paramyrothecium foliicola]
MLTNGLKRRDDFPEVEYTSKSVTRDDFETVIAQEKIHFTSGTSLSFVGSPEFESSTNRWSTHKAPTFVACVSVGTEGDVVQAVRLARHLNIPFLATSSRHGFGRTLGKLHNGLAIDLSRLKSITVDKANATITVGPGTTSDDILAPIDAAGFEFPSGSTSTVSVVSLMIGAGIGRWSGLYGLTTDSLVSARLVTHDGDVVEASETTNSDLFWAIRGAGANLGIITSATCKMHPPINNGDVYCADVMLHVDQAPDYFELVQSIVLNQPAELAISTFIVFDGGTGLNVPLLSINWLWHGTEESGEAVFAPLLALKPLRANTYALRWTEVTKSATFGMDALVSVKGIPRAIYSANVCRYDAATYLSCLEKMSKLYNDCPAARPCAMMLEHFPNQATVALPEYKTAYPWRDATANVLIIMGWAEGDAAAQKSAIDLAKELRNDIAATSGYGGLAVYINYAVGDEDLEQIYCAQKLPRLAQIKKRWDPSNVFRFHHPLPGTYPYENIALSERAGDHN